MEKIPHSLFSTDHLSPGERFDAWREDMSLIFDVEDPELEDDEAFHATFDLYNFGQSVLGKLDSSSARYLRSRKKILTDGLDSILLQLFLEGEVRFGCGKRTTYAKTGDIVVFDLNQPVDNFNTNFKHLTMMLPREIMDAAIPNISKWHGLVLPRRNPAVSLLRNHFTSIFELAPSFEMKAGQHVEAATVSLAAAAMSGKPPMLGGMKESGIEGVLIHQIKRHIRSNLGSENLSPEALARHFGISRAQIYRLMEPVGGIASYIRNLRLHRCMVDLCDPRLAHLNVSEIAYRSGFGHLTTFNRSFREAFGVTPGEAREEDKLIRLSSTVAGSRQLDAEARMKHHQWFRGIGM